jgi:peroxiredoxin
MSAGDVAALQLLMVTAEDLRTLGVTSSVAQKILEATADVPTRAPAIAKKSRLFSPQYKWSRLEIQSPSVIPADEGKATQDLFIHPNAIVMVEIPAPPGAKDFDRRNPPGLVQLGELLRVGDVWKLTQLPQPLEGEGTITTTSVLMQPLLAGASEIAAPSPEMQKLIEELQKLDENPPKFDSAPAAQLASYNARRADLLMNLVSLANGPDEKAQFLKQCVDGLAAAVQTDTYPAGLKRIQDIETNLTRTQPKSAVLPYVAYRRITSQYAVDMKTASQQDQPKVQKAWLDALTAFVDDYPDAEDTPDAMWQLATAEEFASNQSAAIAWYQKLAKAKPGTLAADKAQGALRRIALQGKGFQLNGPALDGGPINTAQYRGKVLLVVYWATWSKLFTDDLPALRALYQQYKGKGFEVLGVCLDVPAGTPQQQKAQLTGYVRQSNIPWPQIYEPGGLDSPPAVQYGIIALPTMILIDKDGEVVSRQSSVDDLKQQLPKLLGAK